MGDVSLKILDRSILLLLFPAIAQANYLVCDKPGNESVSDKLDALIENECKIALKADEAKAELEKGCAYRNYLNPKKELGQEDYARAAHEALKAAPHLKPNPEQMNALTTQIERFSKQRCFGGQVKVDADFKISKGKGYASNYMNPDGDENSPSHPKNREPFAPDESYPDPKEANTFYQYTDAQARKMLRPQLDEQIAYIEDKWKNPGTTVSNTFQYCPHPEDATYSRNSSFSPVGHTCSVTYNMRFEDNISASGAIPEEEDTAENKECKKLVSEKGGQPTGGKVFSSSSSLNNTKPPFCGKKFQELSSDRADKTAAAISRTVPGMGQFVRPTAANMIPGNEPQFVIDDKGINGDGTSGKCAYKWDPVQKREIQLSEAEYPKAERQKSQYAKAIVTYTIPPDKNLPDTKSQTLVTACPYITLSCKIGF